MVIVQLYASKSRALSLYCTNVNQYPAVDVDSQAVPVDSMSVDNPGLRHHSLKHVILYFTMHMFHNHSRLSSNRIIHLFHQFSDCHPLFCCLSYPAIIFLTSCRVVTVRPLSAITGLDNENCKAGIKYNKTRIPPTPPKNNIFQFILPEAA